jgi:cell wall-associated NlpC family hydrolase
MRFGAMRRRELVTLLGGALAWPLAGRAQPAPSPDGTMAEPTGSVLDPRVTPARGDIAASHLAGRIEARRFVEGQAREIGIPQAPLRSAPSHEASLLTEALKGERATIYETSEEGWAWGQLAADGYVGFLPAAALREPGPPATHKVTALRTHVYPGASIKRPPMETLSFGCQLAIERMEEPFAVMAGGGHVPLPHLSPLEASETDFVAVAERFLGTPYLWGGKTSLGVDCSGLLQLALLACGIACPRDSDMQEQALGAALPTPYEPARLQRGDLLFWKGHLAIARDEATIVHANAHHMSVAFEPTAAAIARIRATGSEITGVRRLRPPS